MQSSKLKLKVKNFREFGTTRLFLFLVILLAPLYVVRFRIGPYPSTLLEVLIGLTVAAWVVERARQGRAATKLPITNYQLPITLFLFAAAISVLVSPDKRGALGIFKAYFVEPVLVFFIIKDVIQSKQDWWFLLVILGLSGLWVALLAVFQGLTGQFTFTPHEAALGRSHAVYSTANAVGLYVGPTMFLALGSLGKFRVFGVLGVIAMVLAVILSKSAGAMVGLVVGLGVLGLFQGKGKLLVGLGFLVALVAGIWFFFNISSFTPKNIDPYVRESSETLSFRLCLWEGTRNMLLDRPIFGAGLSGFKELYSTRYFTCDAEPLEYPHNWVLNMWAELGALGLVAFLLILWQYFKSVNVSMRQCVNGDKWITLGFMAAMIYWLVHGLVDVPYFKNDLALEFWVILGLADTFSLITSEARRK